MATVKRRPNDLPVLAFTDPLRSFLTPGAILRCAQDDNLWLVAIPADFPHEALKPKV